MCLKPLSHLSTEIEYSVPGRRGSRNEFFRGGPGSRRPLQPNSFSILSSTQCGQVDTARGGQAASEVERISRHLRPSILDELGLVALMRDVSTEFAERTGVSLRLTSLQLARRLPSDIELTLYRILQEALKNVGQHARARHVTVQLRKQGGGVQLTIQDDGIGFDPMQNYPNTQNGKAGLGLLSMRERASYVGGTLKIISAPRSGTKIEVSIPPGKTRATKR